MKLATWPRSSQLVFNVGLRCPLIASHRANVGPRFLSEAGEQLVRVLLLFSFGLSDFQLTYTLTAKYATSRLYDLRLVSLCLQISKALPEVKN